MWNKEDPKVQEAQAKYDAKRAESKAKFVEKMEQAKETSRVRTEKLAESNAKLMEQAKETSRVRTEKLAESKAKFVEKMEQAKETSRAQTEKLAPITNFMLSVFAFAGWSLVAICVLGVLLEATNGTLSGDNGVGAIVLGAVGYGIVRLCKRSKR